MKLTVKLAPLFILISLCLCFAGCLGEYGAEAQKKAERERFSAMLGFGLEPLELVSEDYSCDFQGWGHYSLVYDLNGSDVRIEPGGDWSDENPAPREVDALASRNGLRIYAEEDWHYIWFYREEDARHKYSALYDTETGLLYLYLNKM